jgi:hypothetical protein
MQEEEVQRALAPETMCEEEERLRQEREQEAGPVVSARAMCVSAVACVCFKTPQSAPLCARAFMSTDTS